MEGEREVKRMMLPGRLEAPGHKTHRLVTLRELGAGWPVNAVAVGLGKMLALGWGVAGVLTLTLRNYRTARTRC